MCDERKMAFCCNTSQRVAPATRRGAATHLATVLKATCGGNRHGDFKGLGGSATVQHFFFLLEEKVKKGERYENKKTVL